MMPVKTALPELWEYVERVENEGIEKGCIAGGEVMNPFFKQVYEVVKQVPHGKVISYGQIARILGRPLAAREVGWAMRCCPEGLPWHRVVMSDGSITGGVYADMRKALLESEDVAFLADGRVNMTASAESYMGVAKYEPNKK